MIEKSVEKSVVNEKEEGWRPQDIKDIMILCLWIEIIIYLDLDTGKWTQPA